MVLTDYQLIVTIVNKGMAGKVIAASKKAGAKGGTVLYGRGSGIHEQAKIFGITIEPEKEIVLILVKEDKCKETLDKIVADVDLAKPGKGIAFVIPVENVLGISHDL